jgi:triphosphoribosyl-dephospho-CoA synthase
VTATADPGGPPSLTRQAFLRACALDVEVMKPGNVSMGAPGHSMTAELFLASAAAAAPGLCARNAPIGIRILDATAASMAAAQCNTNLGIILLCAPLAAALDARADVLAEAPRPDVLQGEVGRRLAGLTVVDARQAYRAIAIANPGGLGSAAEQDIHQEPTVDLRRAMELASDRDLVARQYATGFADVFTVGLAAWGAPAPQDPAALHLAMQRTYLAFLGAFPDSHIVRKHGPAAATRTSVEARRWARCLEEDASAAQAGLAEWDGNLKAAGLNPGTSADLTVATAFISLALSSARHIHSRAG